MQLKALSSLEELLATIDLLCIPASKEKLDIIYHDILSLLIPSDSIPPSSELNLQHNGTILLFGNYQNKRIKILLSCSCETMTEAAAYVVSKKLSIRSKNENATHVGFLSHYFNDAAILESAFAGWTAGQYDIGLYKNNEDLKPRQLALYTFLQDASIQAAEDGITIGMVQHKVMNLVNTPSSHKTPEVISDWVKESAAMYNYTATIIEKPELFQLGMHALLAVNRGSEHPARCIITQYKHPDAAKKITLVGKGVLFDTGGVSIKLAKNMHYMKSDMAGAAAALGAVEACARLGLKVDIAAITPITDNSIDSTAIKPGDVISSYAGKTIEVIDTDAEGRLILADALAYAVDKLKPDVMIDMATLTGSIVASLGPIAAGLFTNNDGLAASLHSAGETSGERVWRMPMYNEYQEDMQSDIADIKNLSEKPYAGAATAAKFLECFTAEHPSWAHLDIAGTAFQANGFGKGYCATAYGVRLIVKWIRQHFLA